MSSSSASLVSTLRQSWLRLGLFGLSAVVAVYLGFLHFSVPEALRVVREAGYFVLLFTFALWLLALWRWLREEAGAGHTPRPGSRDLWLAAGLVAVLTALALTHESFRSKILYDEYVLQSTAYNMHFFRDNSAMVRGYDIQGVFLSVDSYVDKRPGFFAFLLSWLHDLTGYRTANVFVLNGGLFVAGLGLAWWLGWKLNGRRGGLLAAGLLGTLPLYALNATGAGMELLNLCMLMLVIITAAAWLARADEIRLTVLVLSVLLLVQSRYESAVYVGPAALAILLGWWRAQRLVLPWGVIAAPLLLIPVALQQVVVSNSPIMWELHENQTARFSLDYLQANLAAAWAFFSSTGMTQPNSLLLGPAGLVSLIVVAWALVRGGRWRNGFSALQQSLLLFGAGILGVTVLIMFYYWAGFDDPMAARFALPLHLLLALAVVVAASRWDRAWPASWVGLILVAAFLLGSSSPKQAYHFYTHTGNDELAWEKRIVEQRPAMNRLVLTNKSPLPWLIERTSAILLDRARAVADRLAVQLTQPDFGEILVTQGARPMTKDGDYQLPPEEVLPPWFHLELIAERRFGTKLARISRLVAIDLPPDFKPSAPIATGQEAAPVGAPLR